MGKKLFPSEIIDYSTAKLIHDYSRKSYWIYNIVLLAVVACFVALFFITVDVSVGGNGALRSVQERVVISSPIDGKIVRFPVVANQDVEQGDTLLVLEDVQFRSQLQNMVARQVELKGLLNDLQILTSEDVTVDKRIQLETPYYQQAYSSYWYDLSERETKLDFLTKRYERDKKLYLSKIIAPEEFEGIENEYKAAILNMQLFKNRQADQWHYDLLARNNEWRDLSAKIEQLNNQSERLTVVSPCNGNIQQVFGFQENMYVPVAQTLMEISPNSELVAECYVTPKDIGFIRDGMGVRFQIQAYNYNDWGVLTEVYAVSKDVFLNQTAAGYQEAFFKVHCTLDTLRMQLKGGYAITLQKGLTFNARFVVTERTLFQLLYDKVDNWLNPAVENSIAQINE